MKKVDKNITTVKYLMSISWFFTALTFTGVIGRALINKNAFSGKLEMLFLLLTPLIFSCVFTLVYLYNYFYGGVETEVLDKEEVGAMDCTSNEKRSKH